MLETSVDSPKSPTSERNDTIGLPGRIIDFDGHPINSLASDAAPSSPTNGHGDGWAVPNLTGRIKIVDGPRCPGGFCDVYIGELTNERGAEQVAMKMLRIFNTEAHVVKAKKKLRQEVDLWRLLRHPYVLPFYGTCTLDEFRLFMVSPWAIGGNALEYLRRKPSATELWQVSSALEYLHSGQDNPKIVHGDLKADNVLISSTGDALLCDLGLSRYVEEIITKSGSSSGRGGGHARFMAPELIYRSGENAQPCRPTPESDVFAFALLMLQIYTEKLPLSDMSEVPAMFKLAKGELPARPAEPIVLERGLNDHIWETMLDCWKFQPYSRPNMKVIMGRIASYALLAPQPISGVINSNSYHGTLEMSSLHGPTETENLSDSNSASSLMVNHGLPHRMQPQPQKLSHQHSQPPTRPILSPARILLDKEISYLRTQLQNSEAQLRNFGFNTTTSVQMTKEQRELLNDFQKKYALYVKSTLRQQIDRVQQHGLSVPPRTDGQGPGDMNSIQNDHGIPTNRPQIIAQTQTVQKWPQHNMQKIKTAFQPASSLQSQTLTRPQTQPPSSQFEQPRQLSQLQMQQAQTHQRSVSSQQHLPPAQMQEQQLERQQWKLHAQMLNGVPIMVGHAHTPPHLKQFLARMSMTLKTWTLIVDTKKISVYELQLEVLKKGGSAMVNQQNLWPVIGANLGFVHLPADGTNPARANSQVATHLANLHRIYLSTWENMYHLTIMQELKRQATTSPKLQTDPQQTAHMSSQQTQHELQNQPLSSSVQTPTGAAWTQSTVPASFTITPTSPIEIATKQKVPQKRRHSEANQPIPVEPTNGPTKPTGTKQSLQEERLTQNAVEQLDQSNSEPSPKKMKKEEWDSPLSEELERRQQEVDAIQSNEDVQSFFMGAAEDFLASKDVGSAEGSSDDPPPMLHEPFEGISEFELPNAFPMPMSAASSPVPSASSRHPLENALDSSSQDFFDYSQREQDISVASIPKLDTADLVWGSSADFGAKSVAEISQAAGAKHNDAIKIGDGSVIRIPLAHGGWGKIGDEPVSAFYEHPGWKFEGDMTVLESPWAISSSGS